MKNVKVVVDAERYYELLCSELKLSLLEEGGVDNWQGYGVSLFELGTDFHEETDNLRDRLKSDIVNNKIETIKSESREEGE
jgi:hypothetical protein